jgi:hypothetical protein
MSVKANIDRKHLTPPYPQYHPVRIRAATGKVRRRNLSLAENLQDEGVVVDLGVISEWEKNREIEAQCRDISDITVSL